MQPSPIAETRGPVDPSCRVITRNLLYFESWPTYPTDLSYDLLASVGPRDADLKREEEAGDAERATSRPPVNEPLACISWQY